MRLNRPTATFARPVVRGLADAEITRRTVEPGQVHGAIQAHELSGSAVRWLWPVEVTGLTLFVQHDR